MKRLDVVTEQKGTNDTVVEVLELVVVIDWLCFFNKVLCECVFVP